LRAHYSLFEVKVDVVTEVPFGDELFLFEMFELLPSSDDFERLTYELDVVAQ
jgi:hypothetical protein